MPQQHSRGRSIAAITALAVGTFGIGTTEFATMGLLPNIAEAFSTSITHAGSAVTLYALGVVIGAPIITALGAKLNRKMLLVVLAGIFTLGNVAVAAAPTMPILLAARFFTGLPHGAYFGLAAVAAAGIVHEGKRARAMAAVGLGLTVAAILGVPAATAVGSHLDWRIAYLLIAAIGAVTVVAILVIVPAVQPTVPPSVRGEVRSLANPQVILTLLAGAVGFGGMFAVYTYIAPVVTDLAHLPGSAVPWILVTYGAGMTVGQMVAGPLADASIERGAITGASLMGSSLVVFAFTAHLPVMLFLCVITLGISGSVFVTALQMRLLRDSQDAPNLSAAMNHAAFNTANAAGAWLGGIVLAAGYGLRSPAVVGIGLNAVGLALLLIAVALHRRSRASRQVLAL